MVGQGREKYSVEMVYHLKCLPPVLYHRWQNKFRVAPGTPGQLPG